ncbi:hypothetical protein DD556_18340 [Phaeobacter sp. JL2872]|nr:hypothetical protein DD556_18340 [Phaeobacter sp. JL2872]
MSLTGLFAAITALIIPGSVLSQDTDDLAKQLANPVADLISVPLQFNYDRYGGHTDRYLLNIQPVIPFDLGDDLNLITRTIIPVVSLDGPGINQNGVGDIVQSFFLSPKVPTAGGWIWGAGPVFLYPTGGDGVSADTFAAGPTAVALRQRGPWTYGGLANHLRSLDDNPGTKINSTFLNPFLSYTTPTGTSYALQTEATYDWEVKEWSVPIGVVVTQVFTIGSQPVSIGGGVRYWAASPGNGPEGWGARFNFTFLFPK